MGTAEPEQVVFEILGKTSIDKAYPQLAPLNATLPFATYQRVGGETSGHMASATGFAWSRFQIDIVAGTSEALRVAAKDVRVKMLNPAERATHSYGADSIFVQGITKEGNDNDTTPYRLQGDRKTYFRTVQEYILAHEEATT